jgi:hypothetical protein
MRKSIEDHKRTLIDDLASARQSVLEAVRALPADHLDDPILGIWSVKDFLAHLVGWDATNLQAVHEILAGKRPEFFQHYDKDWQSYNTHLVQQYKMEPFEVLLEETAASSQRLVNYLESLPARVLVEGKAGGETGRTVSIRSLLRAEASDEREHAVQVKAFLSVWCNNSGR